MNFNKEMRLDSKPITAEKLIKYVKENYKPDDTILGIGHCDGYYVEDDDELHFQCYIFNKSEIEDTYLNYTGHDFEEPYTEDEWEDICECVNKLTSKEVEKIIKKAVSKMNAQRKLQKGEGLTEIKEMWQHRDSYLGSFWRSTGKYDDK